MRKINRSRARRTGAVGSAAVALSLMVAVPAAAATSGTGSGNVPVPQGTDVPALPGAAAFGDTPASTAETVSFVMQAHDESQLEAEVDGGMTSFLSVSQFAQTYGASPQVISELQQYLRSYGIDTQVYADDVDVVATGTAGQFDKALSVTQQQWTVPQQRSQGGHDIPAQTVHASSTDPELPTDLADQVLAILGLTNYAPFSTDLAQVKSDTVQPDASSSNSCVALTGLTSDCKLPQGFASQYGLGPVYQKGDLGAGQTIGIVTLAAIDPGAPEYYWSNVAHTPSSNRTVTVDDIDGGPGAPSDTAGSPETDLDVEQSGGVAPDANIVVYQAPNTDYGYADAFFTAASQNVAGSVSSSWGSSETLIAAAISSGEETPAYQAAFDEAFLEMAAQGQSGFASAGDDGAYAASADLGTTNLSVSTPSDSPYITAAGGTTDPWSGTLSSTTTSATATVEVTAPRAWGWDYLWGPIATVTGEPLATVAESNVVGGGGGFSTIEPAPSYQQGVAGTSSYNAVQYLTPTDPEDVDGVVEPTEWSFNPQPTVTSDTSAGRAVPDMSANADPYSGYLIYAPSLTQDGDAALEGGAGGTSFVAPAQRVRRGHRLHARPPGRPLEPHRLRRGDDGQLAVHPAGSGRHQQ